MRKRTREILALVLLAALVVIGASAMGYYILVGHNWNAAASHIDDSIGKMEGYTVILYEGTRPLEAEGDTVAGDSEASEGAPSVSQGDAQQDAEQGARDDELPDEPAAEPADSSVDASEAEDIEGLAQHALEDDGRPITSVEDMAAVYRDKGATVFIAHVGDLARYSDPFVVGKGGMRIGFMSVRNDELRSQVRADARALAKQDVDYVLAVTNDRTLCDLCDDGTLKGVSIAICDDPLGDFPNGRYCGSTYCVSSPNVGEVGAVIVSPSGMLITKTVAKA